MVAPLIATASDRVGTWSEPSGWPEDVTESLRELAEGAILCRPRGAELDLPTSSVLDAHCRMDLGSMLRGYLASTLGGQRIVLTDAHGLSNMFSTFEALETILEPEAYRESAQDKVMPQWTSLAQRFVEAQPASHQVSKVFDLLRLARGWDGYDAKPVGERAVGIAVRALAVVSRAAARAGVSLSAPEIGPSPDGSIHLEWSLPKGYVDIECPSEPEPVSFYLQLADGTEIDGDVVSPEALSVALSPVL